MSTTTFGAHSAAPRDKGSGGHQWKFRFPNGYGASVIDDGYGRDQGLYELAVLGPDGGLVYNTPITSDVLGYLNADEVEKTLDSIAALTPESIEAEIIRRSNEERAEAIANLRRQLAALESEDVAR